MIGLKKRKKGARFFEATRFSGGRVVGALEVIKSETGDKSIRGSVKRICISRIVTTRRKRGRNDTEKVGRGRGGGEANYEKDKKRRSG